MNLSEDKSSCEFCSKTIDKYQSSVVKGKLYYRADRLNRFCSLDCARASRRKRELVKCEHCSKEFEKLSNRKRRFCSRDCQWAYEAVHQERDYKKWADSREVIIYQHTCATCGDLFKSKSPRSKYCSTHHRYKQYESVHHERRKTRARERKLRLIKLSGNKCTRCGYDKCLRALSFHHIKPSEKLFTLDSNNLWKYTWEEIFKEFQKTELVCMNCHMEIEDALQQALKVT